jgi:signal transduction histidine kinase
MITVPLLIASLIMGYFLAKEVLAPLFDRNKALDKFVKNTLHELNIPVATIKANVDLLKKNETDPKRLKRLERIELASSNLLNLYNQLNYEIKTEIDKVEIEEFFLEDVVNSSVKKFDEIKKDIIISVDVENLTILADKNGFERVLDNLISNGIKYNKSDGTIKIYTDGCNLVVEDSGIGIEENKLIHIFERYYQSSEQNSGYGIGLHMVKSFCDKNKIGIKIDSKPNFGTRLWLSLQKVCQNSKYNKKLIKKG